MEKPNIREGQWIKIGNPDNFDQIDGYVFNVFPSGELAVGYYQNKLKAIKEDVIWNGEYWVFKYSGPNGSYLRGHDEAIVKRGPI